MEDNGAEVSFKDFLKKPLIKYVLALLLIALITIIGTIILLYFVNDFLIKVGLFYIMILISAFSILFVIYLAEQKL